MPGAPPDPASAGPRAPLVIRLLGPFDVRVGSAHLGPPCSRKGCWLLALLVLRRRGPVDRASLAGTLWPESPESQGLYNLRRELTRLRQALGSEAWRLQSPAPHSLLLDLTGAEVDVRSFDADAAGTEEPDLRRAVEAYRGPLLDGCAEEWVLPERVARAEQYLRALETLAAGALARGDPAAAVPDLRRVIAADPLRESAYRALIRALADRDDFPAALQTYRDLRLLLYRELNAEPSSETRALFDRIRLEGRARAGGEPRPVERPVSRSPRELPRPLTRLIGRDEAAREVADLVRSNRLVTLNGTGGVGKSRLALRVAEEAAVELGDGAWFCDLAPLADPALLPETVAAALGAREDPGRPLLDTVTAFLRPRQGLLLLDNCEHLLDTVAAFADGILGCCPEVRLLLTSRQTVGIFGEVTWRVPSLAFADPDALPSADAPLVAAVTRLSAPQLFVERARQAQPGFEVTPRNARAVAQISFRLDGIPLALELAATRVKALPVEEIAARLDGFLLMTAGSRTALPRHRTLQAAMDWSYRLLSRDEQTLLRRLSVFAGGWTLDAAECVCAGGGIGREAVLDLLAQLVDRSLVVYHERDAVPRYRLLETIRHDARRRLDETGEGAGVRDRHLDFYCRLCERAEPHVFGPVADPDWISRIGREVDNIRAAFEWCSRDAPGPRRSARWDAAMRMAAAVHWQWFHLGTLNEARERLAGVLSRQHLGRPHPRALALTASGAAAFWQGDYGAMRAPLEESLSILREAGDVRDTAYTLCLLGGATGLAGEAERARELGEESLGLARRLPDGGLVTFAFWWLAFAAQCAGDLLAARGYSEQGSVAARECGSRAAVAHHAGLLGTINMRLGDYPAARRFFAQGLELFHAMGDRWGMLRVLQGLAGVAAGEGRPGSAARLLGASGALRERIGASIPTGEQEPHAAMVAAARAALGEAAFREAWEAGRAMTAEAVVDLALES